MKKLKRVFNKILTVLFILISISVSCFFISRTFDASEKKNLWLDESWSLEHSIQSDSYLNILFKGPQGQISKAPLDYFFLKGWNDIKEHVQSFGLPYNTYYRLHPIFTSCLSGFILILTLFFGIRRSSQNDILLILQGTLLIWVLWDYYFREHNFVFSIEMRAYSLWNAIWILTLGLYMHYQRFNKIIIGLLTALAATATAALFQMFSLGLSFMIVGQWNKKEITKRFIISLKVFIIPLLVCIYYLPKGGGGEAPLFDKYLRQFFEFWISMKMIPIFSALGILMTCRFKQLRSHTVVFLTMLILYLISPGINYLAISRGTYFVHRHYRYYELIYPIFLMSLSLSLPVYWEGLKHIKEITRKGIINLIVIILMFGTLGVYFVRHYDEMRGHMRSQGINWLIPESYDYLEEASQSTENIDQKKLKKYLPYYQKIIQYYPEMAEAHGMKGFCLYHLGEEKKAIEAYQKAKALNPHFFWFYYNLGNIYLKNEQYALAVEMFQKALKTKPQAALIFVRSSRMIYMPIIREKFKDFSEVERELSQGYKDCYKLRVLTQAVLEKRISENILKNHETQLAIY